MPYKKNGIFCLFKKNYPEKRIKIHFLFIVDCVCNKICMHLSTKFDLTLKKFKRKKSLGHFQFLLVALGISSFFPFI